MSSAGEEVAKNVQTVATGVRRWLLPSRRLPTMLRKPPRLPPGPWAIAQEANATVAKLGESSNEIGK